MKIGIDARLIPYEQKEGMAYYAYHLIESLLKNDAINDYALFYNLFLQGKKEFVFDLKEVKNARNKIFWIPGKILTSFWTRLHFPPIDFFLGKLDLFHTLAISSSPPYLYLPAQLQGKKIITIHDIYPLIFPEKAKDVFNIKAYKKGLKDVARNADAIICVSQATQKELINFTGLPQEKTNVVYYGLGDDFRKISQPDKIKAVLDKYRITGKYLLNVSRLDYNKNIVNLIKAFYLFRKNYDFKLVITGKKGAVANEVFATINKLGLSNDIIYLDYVPRHDLVVLYSAAELFIFPSLYEGFGFPNLEAMKCETPVISSNIPAIKEAVEDAALLIDPYSPEEIAKAMGMVVRDEQLRHDLINKGKERIRFFSWERTAKDTLAIYEKVTGGS